jgi:hypothetical protein
MADDDDGKLAVPDPFLVTNHECKHVASIRLPQSRILTQQDSGDFVLNIHPNTKSLLAVSNKFGLTFIVDPTGAFPPRACAHLPSIQAVPLPP